jgi:tetratricopeptide (TPR) repeat protein
MRTLLSLAGCLAITAPCFGADPPLAPLSSTEVRQRIEAWMQSQAKNADAVAAAFATWTESASAAPDRLLVTALATAGRVDEELARIVRDLEQGDLSRFSAVAEYLERPDLDPFLATNLRALAGRTLAERRWYDEALEMYQSVDLKLTIDPAAVLFFRAVAAQGLLKFDEALDALDQLLNRTERVPMRYSTTAVLMQEELSRLKEKSLAEIARLMSDSERRLDLGRAGERVQGVQERIIADLDELIKKLEAQQGGGGGGSGSSSNSNESSNPADDSSVKGSTAPGETDKKKFSKEGQWGDMPDKQQAEAKNLINRNFPSHYRQAIETYFKKLANRTAPPQK